MADFHKPDYLEIYRVQGGLQLEGNNGLDEFLGHRDDLTISGAETVSKSRNSDHILISSETEEGFTCSTVKGNDKTGSNIFCTPERGEL